MTAPTFAKGLLAATLLVGAGFVAPQAASAAPLSVPQSTGCGAGRTRDADGHCRRRFNLFDHHDRRHFHSFRSKHCTTLESANGPVRRCRV